MPFFFGKCCAVTDEQKIYLEDLIFHEDARGTCDCGKSTFSGTTGWPAAGLYVSFLKSTITQVMLSHPVPSLFPGFQRSFSDLILGSFCKRKIVNYSL